MCYKCKLHVDIRDEHHLFDILVLIPYLGQNGSHLMDMCFTHASHVLLDLPALAVRPTLCT